MKLPHFHRWVKDGRERRCRTCDRVEHWHLNWNADGISGLIWLVGEDCEGIRP